jgi:4a-hydroxytetrahydrobiopterin dehydratase
MSHSAMVPFAALHFEGDHLRAALMLHDIGDHADILQQRSTNGYLALVAEEEHAIKRMFLARFSFNAVHNESIPRGNAVFLASRFDDCVHKSLEKRGQIKPHAPRGVNGFFLAKLRLVCFTTKVDVCKQKCEIVREKERGNMKKLADVKCPPCDEAGKALAGKELKDLQKELGNDWNVVKNHHLEKLFKFKDFREALAFTNKVGAVAEEVGHHPDIYLTWGKVRLEIFTHSVNGLTKNDFILAAKFEEATKEKKGKG